MKFLYKIYTILIKKSSTLTFRTLSKVTKFKNYLAFLLIFLLPQNLNAAIDGLLDSSSSGEVNVNLVLRNSVKISGVDNLDFSSWDGTGDMVSNDDVCIYANTATYQITVSGTPMINDPNKFAVTSTNATTLATYYLPFLVSWSDNATGINSVQLTPNQTIINQEGADNRFLDCNGGSNAMIIISFAQNDLAQAIAGDYGTSITLSISPE